MLTIFAKTDNIAAKKCTLLKNKNNVEGKNIAEPNCHKLFKLKKSTAKYLEKFFFGPKRIINTFLSTHNKTFYEHSITKCTHDTFT